MTMQITFPGGSRVAAHYHGFDIVTDQPANHGGAGSEPSPYDLFLASLGTCAGFFALSFCRQRRLPVDGMALMLKIDRDPVSRHLDRVTIQLQLPADFPERYRDAILRSIDQCSVKKVLHDPPEIVVSVS
jgi:ribosomal protein S12 methylthiotransferase accessory factor